MADSDSLSGCFAEADAHSDFGLRIGALFAILVISALGGFLPLFLRTKNFDRAVALATIFASGVVLATGLIHILPDASEDLKDECLGLSGEYPWAFVFCGAFIIITFLIEFFLSNFVRRRAGLPLDSHPHNGHAGSSDVEAAKLADNTFGKERLAEKAQMTENKIVAYVLETGVIFHSIFIGIDLGINNEANVVRPLMIAIMFHQAFEGIALGATFVRAKFATLKYVIFMIIYSLVTPVGIAIGIGVSQTYKERSKLALGFKGGFNSASAGILLYNSVVDLLLPSFGTFRSYKWPMQVFAGFVLSAGFAVMALIGKWA